MTLNQAGCEVKITEHAAKEFKSMCEDENKLLENSYLRVGADSGGCSGWKYSLDFEDSIDSEDLTFEQYGVTLVVDKIILNDVIGDVEVDYKKGNLIEKKMVAGTQVKGDALLRTVTTIKKDWTIASVVGVVSANDDLAYDPATSLDSILELTQDGKISNLT